MFKHVESLDRLVQYVHRLALRERHGLRRPLKFLHSIAAVEVPVPDFKGSQIAYIPWATAAVPVL